MSMVGDGVSSGTGSPPRPETAEVMDYIGDVSGQLARLAFRHRNLFLTYLLSMAADAAVSSSSTERSSAREADDR